MRPGARQTDISGVDADAVEQMQNAKFLIDRRSTYGRRLQSVAQRLVEQQDLRRPRSGRVAIPIEDQSIIHAVCSCPSN